MTLRSARTLTAGIALLLGVQLLTTSGTVVLLGRMSPAIERILEENVTSQEAVERMALALVVANSDPEATAVFRQALLLAKQNVTLSDERAEITTLERVGIKALAGDPAARREAAEALGSLGRLNRDAMETADLAAQRLGNSGAWAVVFLGLLGMIVSGVTIRRLQRRVLAPIAEMGRTVAAHRAGDRSRRCTNADATDELALIMTTLNDLFDQHERGSPSRVPDYSSGDRALLIRLLDDAHEPTAAIGPKGDVLAANRAALDLLAGPEGEQLRRALVAVPLGQKLAPLTSIHKIGDTLQWLCTFESRQVAPDTM